MKQDTKPKVISALWPRLCGDNLLATNRLPQRSHSTNHLASIDNLTRTTKRQNTYKRKLTKHKKSP